MCLCSYRESMEMSRQRVSLGHQSKSLIVELYTAFPTKPPSSPSSINQKEKTKMPTGKHAHYFAHTRTVSASAVNLNAHLAVDEIADFLQFVPTNCGVDGLNGVRRVHCGERKEEEQGNEGG